MEQAFINNQPVWFIWACARNFFGAAKRPLESLLASGRGLHAAALGIFYLWLGYFMLCVVQSLLVLTACAVVLYGIAWLLLAAPVAGARGAARNSTAMPSGTTAAARSRPFRELRKGQDLWHLSENTLATIGPAEHEGVALQPGLMPHDYCFNKQHNPTHGASL